MKKKLIFLLFLFFYGCSVIPILVSPIITGVTVWNAGEAKRYYNENCTSLCRSVKAALNELNMPIKKDSIYKNSRYLVAGENDKFKILISQANPHITEVKIRVNFLGDKPYAELLFNQIDLNTNTINFDESGKPTKFKQRNRVSQ